jgi:hypothetical protein
VNEANKQRIRERIGEAGKMLEGKLPPTERHPKGRNPYAHIPQVIKRLCGASYTDLPDDELPTVLRIIEFCEKNPF